MSTFRRLLVRNWPLHLFMFMLGYAGGVVIAAVVTRHQPRPDLVISIGVLLLIGMATSLLLMRRHGMRE